MKSILYVTLFIAANVASAQTASTLLNELRSAADNSACLRQPHRGRGYAPKGFLRGLTLTFARSYCRTNLPNPPSPKEPGTVISKKSSRSSYSDVMEHYRYNFEDSGFNVDVSGNDPLIAEYTLAVGFGMQESSGKYCEGWDRGESSRRPSNEGEAGLFQTSSNSLYFGTSLRRLWDEYKNNSSARCFLNDFKYGVSSCRGGEIGTGAEGLAFQRFSKACPAFATEYALMLSRMARRHYGPLNIRSAQVFNSCRDHFRAVGRKLASNLSRNCDLID